MISFGRDQNATVRLLNLIQSQNGLNLQIGLNNNKIANYNLNFQGEHFAYSVLATAAVIEGLKLDLSRDAFETFKIPKGRGNVYITQYEGKQILLIDDSYNASPASMRAAIRTLSTYSNKRKVALLGDMLELGDESVKFHTDLLDFILEHNINNVCTVGELMSKLYELLPNEIKGVHFNDSDQLKNSLNNIIQNNDVVLVKGSRGIKMDVIIQKISGLAEGS